MIMRRRSLYLAALPALSAGCGPSLTRATLSLEASDRLNPNSEDQPSPLVVRIYELKSIDVFNQLSFFDLYDQDTARLGGDLLNRREIEIAPGRSLTIERVVEPAALHLGAIAGYRTQTNIVWRGSVPLRGGSRNAITIRLDAHSMTVAPTPRRGFMELF
jgi:type VI secretion system protein VasD